MGKHLQRARVAAGEAGEAACEDQQSLRRSRSYALLVGARCDGAFLNLHAAQVLLANLYSEEDIKASIPAVLDRLQKCLPETDHRRLQAEALDSEVSTGDRLASVPS